MSEPLLNNRYKILSPLAEGGESLIYLAEDTYFDEKVVIKRYKDSIQPNNQNKWLQESTLLKELRLQTVVKSLDTFISKVELVSYGYVVQEYVEGQTLEEEFQSKRYTQQEVKDIIIEVLQIIDSLQELTPPIIHRDIKPSNIIRRKSDHRLQLLDFGLAMDHGHSEYGYTMGVGTLGYQAPEQIEGFPNLGSDVYSVGVMAVQFLSRKMPIELIKNGQLMWKQAISTAKPEWNDWLLKVLVPQEQRFKNAQEALLALQKMSFIHHSFFKNDEHPKMDSLTNHSKKQPIDTTVKAAKTIAPETLQYKNAQREGQELQEIFGIQSPILVPSQPQEVLQTTKLQEHRPQFSAKATYQDDKILHLEATIKRLNTYFLLSCLSFPCFSFISLIFIMYFAIKKSEVQKELNQLKNRTQNPTF